MWFYILLHSCVIYIADGPIPDELSIVFVLL